MSRPTPVNCPFCSTPQTVNVYQSVNVTIDPSLKEKVIKGTLNDKNCENCGKEISIVSGFLYHDMEKKVIISLNTSENQEAGIASSEENPFLKQKGYIIREVFTYPELIEKIRIFDLNLNDNVIKQVGDDYKPMFKEVIKDIELHVFFEGLEKGLFKKKLVFVCFTHPEQMMKLKQPIKNITKEQQQLLYNLDILRN